VYSVGEWDCTQRGRGIFPPGGKVCTHRLACTHLGSGTVAPGLVYCTRRVVGPVPNEDLRQCQAVGGENIHRAGGDSSHPVVWTLPTGVWARYPPDLVTATPRCVGTTPTGKVETVPKFWF
jgi:hypothetical protein